VPESFPLENGGTNIYVYQDFGGGLDDINVICLCHHCISYFDFLSILAPILGSSMASDI